MKIGYARVSTQAQDNKLQNAELKKGGCERIFIEKASGGRWDRPQLHKMLNQLREGDVVVVWKLDRLSRSLKDLLTILERIDEAGAEVTTHARMRTGPAIVAGIYPAIPPLASLNIFYIHHICLSCNLRSRGSLLQPYREH